MSRAQPREATRSDESALAYPIGEAARQTGVSTGMLRLWERERLIRPRRTPGGHRFYSAGDLQRLRQIAHLRRVDRLNAAAIRQVLGSAIEPNGESPALAPDLELGSRLRRLRTERKLSLATVAERVGLSVSFLSAVELGQSSISVGNLFKLADAYGTTVPGLGPDYRSEQRSVIRPRDRPRFVAGQGKIMIEDLIAAHGTLEAQRIEVKPGGGSEEAYSHPGEEFVYVLSGHIVFWLDASETYHLETGDSLFFRSTQPHRWANETAEPVTVLWINVPVVDPAAGAVGERGTARPRNGNPTS
ncbi:MAG: cupin domain-containing protein [Chloroflexota bacterium]|nr:cupin domain-containing protein [Chloroflexota bacterium]